MVIFPDFHIVSLIKRHYLGFDVLLNMTDSVLFHTIQSPPGLVGTLPVHSALNASSEELHHVIR